FSLRTLEAVKVMSQADAQLFTRFCSFLWVVNGDLLPIYFLEWQFKLHFYQHELTHLEAIGFVSKSVGNWHIDDLPSPFAACYGGKEHRFTPKGDNKRFPFGACMLTEPGTQLAPLSGAEPLEDYHQWVIEFYSNMFDITGPFADKHESLKNEGT